MKLYWGPHTCAVGIHILLEEIGAPYEAIRLDVAQGETRQPDFLAINPKGKVPALVRDDGSVLTEFAAIATWLARTHPEADLLADNVEAGARALEMMDYAVGTVHAQGFGRIFKPASFLPPDLDDADALAAVKTQGKKLATEGLEILGRALGAKDYAAGTKFTIADAALFYIERWTPKTGIDLPANLAAHFDRLRARPAVHRALQAEGESLA